MKSRLGKVALAISSYRNDQSVLAHLEEVFKAKPPFGAVIVVDSLGTGEVQREATKRGWKIHYINADENLGSAGNLAQRLKASAELGMDWCYAVNHDGNASQAIALKLLEEGAKDRSIGAVYPAIRYSLANARIEPPRRKLSPFSPRNEQSDGPLCEVAWGSSNSALYNLAPIRDGLNVWCELWMGWEDLAYGWLLANNGWRQIRCADVEVEDTYEYQPVKLLGRQFHIADKPPWYMYYQLRNLVLIARRSHWRAVGPGTLAARTVGDLCLTALKQDRGQRISLLLRGLVAGFRGETGKGRLPN